MRLSIYPVLLLLFALLTACIPSADKAPTENASVSSTPQLFAPTATVAMTREEDEATEPTVEPTPTQTPLPSPTPTETMVSTATPTATALPFPDEPITVDNAHLIEPLVTYGKGTIWDFDLSPDGSLLAIGASTGVYLYDAQSLEEIRHAKPGLATDVAFSPDGTLLAVTISSENSGTIYIIDVDNNEEQMRVPREDFWSWGQLVDHVTFNSTGSMLIVRERDRVRVWDVASGSELRALEVGRTNSLRRKNSTWSLALSQNGRWLASTHIGTMTLTVWDSHNNYERTMIDLESTPYPGPLAFSPDGRLLAVGFGNGWVQDIQATIELWDLEEGTLLQSLSGPKDFVSALAFSPNGHFLAASGHDGIKIWDLQESEVIHHLDAEREPVTRYAELKFSPDGTLLFSSATEQGGVSVWNVDTGEKVESLIGFTSYIHELAFLPNSQRAALKFDDDSIRLWDMSDSSEELVFVGGGSPANNAVAVSPDGQFLVTGRGEFNAQEIVVLNIDSREIVAELPVDYSYVSDLLFSSDGRYLLSYYDDFYTIEAELWDTSSWQRVVQHQVSRDSYDYRKQEFHFSPDGMQLVAALEERLELWSSLGSGNRQLLFEERGTSIWDAAMLPGGDMVAVLLRRDSPQKSGYWLMMLDVNTRTEVKRHELPISENIYRAELELIDDGRVALINELGTMTFILVDVNSGKVLGRIPSEYPVVAPDGRLIVAMSSTHGRISVWGIPDRE